MCVVACGVETSQSEGARSVSTETVENIIVHKVLHLVVTSAIFGYALS